ncbi:MAG TPA: prepilin peptidase [Symbiobacteriaceae bacterium]|nr:prepilin peptidase [Symbiobacteriaceae bacterium]
MAPWAIAVLLFPCGLVAGSFCTVLHHRIRRGESVVWPGSHCPTCHHSLGLADLVPVLSYLAFRGRCRYCRTAIPGRYVLLELATGLTIAAAGLLGGWMAGFGVLMVWVTAVAVFSRPVRRPDAGITLVEVLVAVSLLVLCMVPMLDLGAELRVGNAHNRQVAIMLARTQLEALYDVSLKTAGWPPSGQNDWQYLPYQVEWTVTSFAGSPSSFLRQAVVTVSCDSCGIRPVTITAVLAKSQN